MVAKKQIDEFLKSEPLALVGVSRNPRKFGYTAFKELKEKGMNVIPVNPYADEILGIPVCKDIRSLPPDVKGLIIMTKKEQTRGVIEEAREKGIKQIWIQQMSDDRAVVKELEGTDINVVTKECILMYYKPNGIHKFHRAILKFFGRLPR